MTDYTQLFVKDWNCMAFPMLLIPSVFWICLYGFGYYRSPYMIIGRGIFCMVIIDRLCYTVYGKTLEWEKFCGSRTNEHSQENFHGCILTPFRTSTYNWYSQSTRPRADSATCGTSCMEVSWFITDSVVRGHHVYKLQRQMDTKGW